MNVEQALLFGKWKLNQYDIESYAIDATLLLMKAMSFTKVQIYTNNHVILTQKQQKEYLYDLEQRIQGKPIQYITGVCEFMGLPFTVQEGVLIPRADTEILVETVLQYHEKEHFQNAIDICTGTGCIAVSLAKYTDISMYGVDISERALQIAKKNAQNHAVSVTWFQSDLFQNVPISLAHFDCIVSNPPYIATKEIQTLMNSVKCFEPHLALDGGEYGTDFYKKITQQSKQYLKKGAFLFFEIGYQQAEAVCSILNQNGFDNIVVRKDLAGLDRVVLGQYMK